MKKIFALSLSLIIGQTVMAQVPKSLIGKTFYNTNRWNMDPRFGGVPTVRFDAANKATVKKGDIMENATVKKYKTGFILTTAYRKISDTFQFEQFPAVSTKSMDAEMRDQHNHLWSTRFSPYKEIDVLKSFPAAKEDYKRNVINLPQRNNEDKLKIEIYAGILQEVDCNGYMMLGSIDSKNLEGYGYTYYDVTTEERIMGTMKGCPDSKKTLKYISLQPIIVPYNSKLPLVIYAPENVQIRYKVYTSNNEWEFARPQ